MKKIILGCIASMYMALSIMPVFAVDRFNDTLVDNTQSIKNNVDTSFQTQNGIQ
jgi:hypothetical protein